MDLRQKYKKVMVLGASCLIQFTYSNSKWQCFIVLKENEKRPSTSTSISAGNLDGIK